MRQRISPTRTAAIWTSHDNTVPPTLDLTVAMLALMDSMGDRDRSTTNGMANIARKAKTIPGMMHRIDPIDVPMATNNAVSSTAPRLRGLKNDPMVTGL